MPIPIIASLLNSLGLEAEDGVVGVPDDAPFEIVNNSLLKLPPSAPVVTFGTIVK